MPEHAESGSARQQDQGNPPSRCSSSASSSSSTASEEEPEEKLEAWEEGGVAEACRKKLADAVMGGDIGALQAALAEAQRLGLHSREARRARDALLALEASDFQKRTTLVVDEAIESDDWWKLQAAMQLVVGGLGGDSELVGRLKDAMRMQKKRQEAVRELRKAAEARDGPRLRQAIEAALLVHAREADVKRARDALRALDVRPALREQLQKAAASKDLVSLRAALEAARRGGLQERAPDLLREDPEERRAFEAAERVLKEVAVGRFRERLYAGDMEGAEQALEEAKASAVDAADLTTLSEELSVFRERTRLVKRLQEATEAGTREALSAAIEAAEAPGVVCDVAAELGVARAALQAINQRAQEGVAKAQAAQELALAMQGEDLARLSGAIATAEARGLTAIAAPTAADPTAAPTLGQAKERLRLLQARAGAARELDEAARSSDVYRLRGALAAAQAAGVSEAELRSGREALRVREAQSRVRKTMDTALAQQDGETLQRSLQEARQLGFNRQELARAEAALHTLGQSRIGQDLLQAIAANDADRIRQLAGQAAAAGVAGTEVARAWEKLRELEAESWLRKQLQEAAARGDSVRLRAAIRQAEAGGLDGPDLEAARAQLANLSAKLHAIQELQLARSGGNFYTIQAAIRDCERVGLTREEVDAAMRGGVSASVGAGGEPFVPPVTSPQLDTQATTIVTDPQLAFGSGATNPQLSSSATVPRTHLGSVATNTISSIATDPYLLSSTATDLRFQSVATDVQQLSTGPYVQGPGAIHVNVEAVGLLQNRVTSHPLPQPRPDEPAGSMCEGLPVPTTMLTATPQSGRRTPAFFAPFRL